jgi:hypothetical protein
MRCRPCRIDSRRAFRQLQAQSAPDPVSVVIT